jgi:hypothetical protein
LSKYAAEVVLFIAQTMASNLNFYLFLAVELFQLLPTNLVGLLLLDCPLSFLQCQLEVLVEEVMGEPPV